MDSARLLKCTFYSFLSLQAQAALSHFRTRCTELRHLNFRSCAASSTELADLLSHLPHLVHVDFSETEFCPLDAVKSLSARGASSFVPLKLESMILTDTCTSDDSLLAFIPYVPALRRLDLYQCDHVTDHGLCGVFDSCPSLHNLTVGGGMRITDRFLHALATSQCVSVFEELHVSNELYDSEADSASELDYRALSSSKFGTPEGDALLQKVLVELGALPADPSAAHGSAPAFTTAGAKLDLNDAGLVALVSSCRRFRVLDVTGLGRMTDTTLAALARHAHSSLVSLTVDFCPQLTCAGVSELLRGCSQLRHLSLFGCAGLHPHAARELLPVLARAISGQRLLAVRIDSSESSDGALLWPRDAWNRPWSSRECKHLVLSGRRSFGWDLADEADYDREFL